MNDTTPDWLGKPNPKVSNEEFIAAVFKRHRADERPVGCWFAHDPTAADLDRSVWAAQRIDIGTNLPDTTAVNSFFAVSLFHPDDTGRYRRRIAQFAEMRALVLDDLGDGSGAKASLDALDGKPLPSWVLETSPGNYQVGYILAPGERDPVKCVQVQTAMIEQGLMTSRDPGMKGVTRYMRLPVGQNTKRAYQGQDNVTSIGFKHVMHVWMPQIHYTLDELVAGYGLTLDATIGLPSAEQGVLTEQDDPVFLALQARGLVKSVGAPKPDGSVWAEIECPWLADHTGRADSGAAYRLGGGFQCHHGHCEDRGMNDLMAWLAADGESGLQEGLNTARARGEFDDVAGFEPVTLSGQDRSADVDPFDGSPSSSELEATRTGTRPWLVRLKDLTYPPVTWGWDGMVETGGMHLFFGDPNAGKSLAVQLLALGVAAGRTKLLGRALTLSGPVVYLVGEGHHTLQDRFVQLGKGLGMSHAEVMALPIHVTPYARRLTDSDCRDIGAELARDVQPALVVMDTMRAHMLGSDKDDDATEAVLAGFRDWVVGLSQATGVVVHHSGHAEKERSRGSSNIRAVFDLEWQVERPTKGVHRLTCRKWRNGPLEERGTVGVVVSGGGGALTVSDGTGLGALSGDDARRAVVLACAARGVVAVREVADVARREGVGGLSRSGVSRLVTEMKDEGLLRDSGALTDAGQTILDSWLTDGEVDELATTCDSDSGEGAGGEADPFA